MVKKNWRRRGGETGDFLLWPTTGSEAPIFWVWLFCAVQYAVRSCSNTGAGRERFVERLLTIHHLPLFVEPALGLLFALQHNVVALQPARQVVPRRGDHGVLALEVLDDLLVSSLVSSFCQCPGTSVVTRSRHMNNESDRKGGGGRRQVKVRPHIVLVHTTHMIFQDRHDYRFYDIRKRGKQMKSNSLSAPPTPSPTPRP